MLCDLNGNVIGSVFDLSGRQLTAAYDFYGNPIYSGSVTLKIMTYNVGQWYYGSGTNVPADKDADYYALQNGMIQQINPDILCIQEYWKQFSKLPRTAISMLQQYFPFIHEQGGNNGYFGRCICSKYPITDYTVRSYSNDSNRYYDSCTVTANGIPITITNTHTDVNSQDKRDGEITELISYLQTQSRFIACGDYNTTISSDDKTTQAWIKNIKPYIDAGFSLANCNEEFYYTCSDYPDGNWYGCLDNVIVPSNAEILSAYVDETKRTDNLPERIDHMPFVVTVKVN